MLRWRLISAGVILTLLITLLYLDFRASQATAAWLMPVVLVFGWLSCGESLRLLSDQRVRPATWVAYTTTILMLLAAAAPLFWNWFGDGYPADCPLGKPGWVLLAVAVGILLTFADAMRRYQAPGDNMQRIAWTMLVIIYPGLLLSFLVLLRFVGDHLWGWVAVVSMILVVKVADTGAYFTGRVLGRHKLAPKLSPGKTIEGVIGGLATACLASLVFFQWVVPLWIPTAAAQISPLASLVYAVALTLAGLIGDLAESLFKRDMGRKDSGWVPGLGGILDILDSLLAAAPVAYVWWLLLL